MRGLFLDAMVPGQQVDHPEALIVFVLILIVIAVVTAIVIRRKKK